MATEVEQFLQLDTMHYHSMVRALCWRSFLRACLVVATGAVAWAVPYFGTGLGLLGGMGLSAIVFIFPVLINWKLRGSQLSWLENLFGFIVLGLGTFSAGLQYFSLNRLIDPW